MRRKVRSPLMLPHIQTVRKGGKVYRYARPPKGQRVKLPDLPIDHPEFLAAYQRALAPKPVTSRAPSGSIAAMVDAFQRSDRYLSLGATYRTAICRHLGIIRAEAEDAEARHLKPVDIRADLAPLAPNIAAARLKAWRLLCSWGAETELLASDPSEGIKRKRLVQGQGFLPWDPEHIEAFRARWPFGTPQRLCMEVIFWTGARISDAVLIGEGMVGRDGILAFRQVKTGEIAYVPWTCPLPAYAVHLQPDRDLLHAALAARTSRHMTFLATAQGRSRSHKSIGNLISEAAADAGFDRSAHGLRKSRAMALAEGGATTHQIASWTGHMTLAEVQHYTESANRRAAVMGETVNRPDPAIGTTEK